MLGHTLSKQDGCMKHHGRYTQTLPYMFRLLVYITVNNSALQVNNCCVPACADYIASPLTLHIECLVVEANKMAMWIYEHHGYIPPIYLQT